MPGLAVAACLLSLSPLPGDPLPAWTPGYLDIHQIDTGRGNAALLVLPDGANVLVDAGTVPDRPGLELGPRLPNASKSTGGWIVEYIRQFGGRQPARLDYALLTHHHDDHVAAFPDVAASLPIRTVIDRGLDPIPPPFPSLKGYFDWRQTRPVEAFRVGEAGQIACVKCPNFEIRNVAGNGRVWTGRGASVVQRFPADWRKLPDGMRPNENQFSLAVRLRYGPFDYFTGGDLVGTLLDGAPDWHDLETPVAKAIGAVEAAVLNHHGWLDSTNATFLRLLAPQVVIVPAWHASHPDHSVLRRLRSPEWKPSPPDLFITALLEAPRAILRYLGEPFKSTRGHIVIRVEPGGSEFRVYVLDSAAEQPGVIATFGPYRSR